MNITPGVIVDNKYTIVSSLGMGGYGVVYRAKHNDLGRDVALKILHEHVSLEEETIKRFEREAQVLNRLHHRNLVMFYGYGSWQGSSYIVMEFVQGKSLQAVLNEVGALSVQQSAHILVQICDALFCAHSNDVVHRDLKPSNIILLDGMSDRDNVKIIDFGLAKSLEQSTEQSVTQEGFTVGTVEYMSPEQCLAKPVDSRSDIYAAGCILYRCVTGTPPFTSEDCGTLLQQHVYDEPTPVGQFFSNQNQPPALLQTILSRSMAKDPDDRYASIKDFKENLITMLEQPGFRDVTSERKKNAPDLPTSTSHQSHLKRSLILGSVVVASLLAFGATLIFPQGTSRRDEDAGQQYKASSSLQLLRANSEIVHGPEDYKISSDKIEVAKQILKLDDIDHLLHRKRRFNLTYRLCQALREEGRFDELIEQANPALTEALVTRSFYPNYYHLLMEYLRSAKKAKNRCDPSPLVKRIVETYPKDENFDSYMKIVNAYAESLWDTRPEKAVKLLENFIVHEPAAAEKKETQSVLERSRICYAQELMASGDRKECANQIALYEKEQLVNNLKFDTKWDRRVQRIKEWLGPEAVR